MSQSYLRIRNEYLVQAWARSPAELAVCLPAEIDNDCLVFRAFGEKCMLSREEILLSGESAAGPVGLLVALYASYVPDLTVQLQPLKSFKELPHSMPYHAAFAANAEQILVPQVTKINLHQEKISSAFSGYINQDAMSGDFSFTLWPLPRIPLYYIFHLPDDEFPASVTCLFPNNASLFMPIDGLADVAEYTAKKIINIIDKILFIN
jgi:hypothetical protein